MHGSHFSFWQGSTEHAQNSYEGAILGDQRFLFEGAILGDQFKQISFPTTEWIRFKFEKGAKVITVLLIQSDQLFVIHRGNFLLANKKYIGR